MRHEYCYQSDRLLLRPLSESDAEQMRLLRNRAENRIWFFHQEEITAEMQHRWYQNYLKTETDYMFAMAPPVEPSAFWGAAAIYPSRDDAAGMEIYEVGRLLLDSRNPNTHGLGIEVSRCVCGLCRSIFTNNVRLKAEAYSDNERSMYCFLGNGFRVDAEINIDGRQISLLSRVIDTKGE